MKFKGVESLTGKELCEIEDIMFPLISELDEGATESDKKKATVSLIIDNGERLVQICYTTDANEAITDVNEPYKVRLMQEAIVPIMKKLFSGSDEGKPKKKANPKRILPR